MNARARKERLLRKRRRVRFDGRRDHARLALFEGCLLFRDLGAREEVLEQRPICGRDTLEFAKLHTHGPVRTAAARQRIEGCLQGVLAGFGDVVIILQVGDDARHFGRNRALDVALLCSRIDDRGMSIGIARCCIRFLAGDFRFLLAQIRDDGRAHDVRDRLQITAAFLDALSLLKLGPLFCRFAARGHELAVEFRELLLRDGHLAFARNGQIVFLAELRDSLFRSAHLLLQAFDTFGEPGRSALCCIVTRIQAIDDVGIGHRIGEAHGLFRHFRCDRNLDDIGSANARHGKRSRETVHSPLDFDGNASLLRLFHLGLGREAHETFESGKEAWLIGRAELVILLELVLLDDALKQAERGYDRDLTVDGAALEIELGQHAVGAEHALLSGLKQDFGSRGVSRSERKQQHERRQHHRNCGCGDELPAAEEEVDELA